MTTNNARSLFLLLESICNHLQQQQQNLREQRKREREKKTTKKKREREKNLFEFFEDVEIESVIGVEREGRAFSSFFCFFISSCTYACIICFIQCIYSITIEFWFAIASKCMAKKQKNILKVYIFNHHF